MKLSIIIPVYNTAEFLPVCLDSVTYPDLENYEIIIVNDGSTDNSLEIVEAYAAKQTIAVNIISTENGGLGAARNVGIKSAKGEYLLFLDSDDRLAPGALPEILETLNSGYDIYIHNLQQVNIDGEFLGCIYGAEKEGLINLSSYPELLFQSPAACNKIVRRTLMLDHNIFFPGRVWFEDLHTTPKYYVYADKIQYINKNWYYYLMRSGSITNSRNTERNIEIIDAVNAAIDFYKQGGRYEEFRSQLEYMAFYNQFLTSSTRVNLSQWNSPVQSKLYEDFIAKFPNYLDNPYVKSMPFKYRLLEKLLRNKNWLMVHIIMKSNSIIKKKKV